MPTTTPPRDEDDQEPPRLGTLGLMAGPLRQRTLAGLEAAWADLQRAVAAPVELGAADGPQQLLDRSRLVGALDKRLKCMAVIALIVHGSSWREVAHRLGMPDTDVAYAVYGQAVARWAAGDPEPWIPTIEGREVVA